MQYYILNVLFSQTVLVWMANHWQNCLFFPMNGQDFLVHRSMVFFCTPSYYFWLLTFNIPSQWRSLNRNMLTFMMWACSRSVAVIDLGCSIGGRHWLGLGRHWFWQKKLSQLLGGFCQSQETTTALTGIELNTFRYNGQQANNYTLPPQA